MDCPSEEQMIRMKLDGLSQIKSLHFNIPDRKLQVIHQGDSKEILFRLETLKYDTTELASETFVYDEMQDGEQSKERTILWTVLLINFAFFAIESFTGFLFGSMGLVADSLDMLADSMVYGLSLWAVGGSVLRKKQVARLAGYMQLILAVLGLVEVVRRFLGTAPMPEFYTMIGVSLLALGANVLCLYLLQKSKSKEAHMQASMIFTSNDILINAGVIVAGILVFVFQSPYPDLLIGMLVFVLVARGAYRILLLGK
jgi:Co/Zn/Cd efflux system component